MDCWHNPKYFSHANCRVEYIDRYTQLVSSTCYLLEPQSVSRMHISSFYKFRVFRKFIVEFDVNLCEMSSNNTSVTHPLLIIALPIIRQYSTFDMKCPFQGNITIDRLMLDNRFVPNLLLPSGQYRLNIRMYHPNTNETQIDAKIYFTIPESRNAHVDRRMG